MSPRVTGSTTRRLSVLIVGIALTSLASEPSRAATILVTTLDDDDSANGLCSLREAIVAADQDSAHQGCTAGSGVDRIEFSVLGTILLGDDLPVITKGLTIAGPAFAPQTAPAITINADHHRLLVLNGQPDGRTLRIDSLWLRNGFTSGSGGCVRVGREDQLVLVDSTLSGCEAAGEAGAIFGDFAHAISIQRSTVRDSISNTGGGAIYLLGEGYDTAFTGPTGSEPTATLQLVESTIANNESFGFEAGGGVTVAFANGAIRRSTVSGNRTEGASAGILFLFGTLEIESTTITGNTADSDDDETGEFGAGLFAAGSPGLATTVLLKNSVVGNNFDGPLPSDVYVGDNSAILSLGFNLVGVRDGATAFFPLGTPNANDDWIGERASPVVAGLAPLADNGGPTRTHAPTPGSPLVDHGDCADDTHDQRGYGNIATFERPVDNILIPDSADGCDIGAYEADAVELSQPIFLDGFESGDTGGWTSTVT